eukprot:scaffold136334_cov16-Prasinocladus_malaysianus.AAC.1
MISSRQGAADCYLLFGANRPSITLLVARYNSKAQLAATRQSKHQCDQCVPARMYTCAQPDTIIGLTLRSSMID